MMKRNKGITLVALIITIVVLLIISGIVIKTIFGEEGLIEKTKKTKFINNFLQVKELVEIYRSDKTIQDYVGENNNENEKLPIKSKITDQEIKKIKDKNPTLEETIKTINKIEDISHINLYWIDLEKIGANIKHKYLIDIDSMQIYDYEGEYFSKKRWHVLEMGVDPKTLEPSIKTDNEIFDGWITLTLYYPSSATEKMWRIGEEGETRTDENLTWEEYNGPITIRLGQVENIWIKYKLNGETVIIPPLGKLLVDIEVNPTKGKQESVNVKINFDSNAETKQYRINGGNWQNYNGEFTVTENVLVEARGIKKENIYDSDGNILKTQTITGKDTYFIDNIGTTEEITETIPAPQIKRLEAKEEGEVARVEIIYPDNATEKIYKINYGQKENYTEEIGIKEYDTVITAYYKTEKGTSLSARLYISKNESESSNSENYNPYKYHDPSTPKTDYNLNGPTIGIETTNNQATITITTQKNARNIYVKLGNDSYKEYTEPITVNENMIVRAYYIAEEDGMTSDTSYERISGLHQGKKPSVIINADPYPYGNNKTVDKVNVTITTNATEAQYSFDGVVYKKYNSTLEITSNCRIYAKATNDYGTTIEHLDITNISNIPPSKKEKLTVNIMADPEPKLTTNLTDNTKITISYDNRATEKYYSIGKYGELKEYQGSFTVTQNCTIYAYAISSNGIGQTSKIIDNITTGIAEPIIEANPDNNQATTKTTIKITFDQNAKTTKYEINNEGLINYTGELEVTENCTIRAINTNSLGQSSETTYKVQNITATAPALILDRGEYYLLKLPFPDGSENREYKYKQEGTWKSYNNDGILLIKPDKKDEVLSNDKIKIKIIDENGRKINFKGDWYLLDTPISKVFEYISMRWDRAQSVSPTILLNTNEPTRKAIVTITYPNTLVKKQYKIIYPDEKQTDWTEYKEPITVDKKGTIIYARGIDDAEVYSKEATLKINNIDEDPPIIKLTADLENAQQKVGVKVMVTDDTQVDTIKWAKGNLGESYFLNNGTAILNNSVVNLNENGIYTFYAIDSVGNTQIYTLTITNIDNTPPKIDIKSTPDTIGIESTITIDYEDSTIKEYKIGDDEKNWKTYKGPFTITSNEVIANNAVNSDYTVTIYAKGKDSAGNEIIEKKKILNLDLDAPKTPVITSNYGYPILTEYGVQTDGKTSINYDTRKDITNYYSIDGGKTWNNYTGAFQYVQSGTIYAKSIKNSTGLETITSKTVTQPSDALAMEAYDGDDSTSVRIGGNTKKYIKISPEMIGKKVYINAYKYTFVGLKLEFSDSDKKEIASQELYRYNSGATKIDKSFTIPENASYMTLYIHAIYSGEFQPKAFDFYEVKPDNEPLIKGNQYYSKLTESGVEKGYCTATISYDNTSIQKLYKIDNGQWQTYPNKAIRIEIGQTLYVKGIDKKGNETRTIPTYTATLPSDALGLEAYDENDSTSVYIKNGENKIIQVDKSIWEKSAGLTLISNNAGAGYLNRIEALDESGNVLNSYNVSMTYTWNNKEFSIPQNTKYLKFTASSYDRRFNFYIYEIREYNIPKISGTQYYPKLTGQGVEKGYVKTNISYYSTSTQKLYKIDDGQWQTYQNKEIKLEIGQTIYAKGIDKNGNETKTISTYTATLPSDALGLEAYDGDDSTSVYISYGKYKKIEVDQSIWGKAALLTLISNNAGAGFLNKVEALDESEKALNSYNVSKTYKWNNHEFSIPQNTKYLKFSANSYDNRFNFYIYEINGSN